MKAILVTGGAGYIGSHICKALAEKEYLPITIDNLSTGNLFAVKWGLFYEGNISNQALIKTIIEKHSVCGVIHLAAYSNIRESHKCSMEYFQNNVGATLKLLEVLKEKKISSFVFSSTCSVYGIPHTIPIQENHKKIPINPYGKSKLTIEKILQSTPDFKSAILRYFNAAGADLEGEIGESHHPETHLIPLLIQKAMGKKEAFILNGEDHKTEDGTPVRDFIHVSDLAEAHIQALEYLIEKEKTLILNLGTGKGHSIRSIISQVEKKSRDKIPIVLGKRFSGDPPILIANGKKAAQILGWKPRHTISTIIETAWNWHKRKVGMES